MKTAIAILLLAASLGAEDNWERMRQCTAQAEKVCRRDEAEGCSSHYNSKRKQCFVEESMPGLAHMHRVSDAFENYGLASSWTDLKTGKRWCSSALPEEDKRSHWSCEAFNDFVVELMSQ
jgi:hypothetical protein